MRYVAPPREQVAPATFEQPVFARYAAHRELLAGLDWPSLDALDARLRGATHPVSGRPLRFVAQTPALAADGLHYETRIFERGAISTRERNWHDLINALAWIEHRAIKAALNARQAADIARVGPKTRTRGQCALTHFDEAGAIVTIRDAELRAMWDAHDWHGLFWRRRDAWLARGADAPVEVIVFGHALHEHALAPHLTVVTKALAVAAPRDGGDVETALAQAIVDSRALIDPQELRPLPLSGIPGWHADNARERFYLEAPCFRPLREGRVYPAPVVLPTIFRAARRSRSDPAELFVATDVAPTKWGRRS